MRIVAGSARGRPLKGPDHPGLRPTSDRVRESIFNILGQRLDGLRVLDLFAGTGALGLEAISRGAAAATLMDEAREAVTLCRANAAALGFTENVQVVATKVTSETLRRLDGPFDLVFADPPYRALEPEALLTWVSEAGLLAPGGTVVLEHDRRIEIPARAGALARIDVRRFGDTCVSFLKSA